MLLLSKSKSTISERIKKKTNSGCNEPFFNGYEIWNWHKNLILQDVTTLKLEFRPMSDLIGVKGTMFNVW